MSSGDVVFRANIRFLENTAGFNVTASNCNPQGGGNVHKTLVDNSHLNNEKEASL